MYYVPVIIGFQLFKIKGFDAKDLKILVLEEMD